MQEGEPQSSTKAPVGRLFRRLQWLAFLLVIVLPVVLVLWPLRDTFYPPQFRELSALAQVDRVFDPAAVLQGLPIAAERIAVLREFLAAEDPAAMGAWLERSRDTAEVPALALLQAFAELQQSRPAPAAVRLEELSRHPHPGLETFVSWYLAQAYLMIGRADLAGRRLQAVTSSASPLADRATVLLGQLTALRSPKESSPQEESPP